MKEQRGVIKKGHFPPQQQTQQNTQHQPYLVTWHHCWELIEFSSTHTLDTKGCLALWFHGPASVHVSSNLTWQPFWQGRLRCPDACPLERQKTRAHCCCSLLCWSTPTLLMEAGSWCGGRPAQDYKTMSTVYTDVTERTNVYCCGDKREVTFSPAKVTMSRGPYMKRPVTTCWESSVNTASFTRWFAVTFCQRSERKSIDW